MGTLTAMDARLETLLDDLHREGVEHDAPLADRTRRSRNLEPDSARLLHLLVLATGAGRVLELGTSNGYSTVWLAAAVAANEGAMVSVDFDGGRLEEARDNVTRAGFGELVDLRLEDADFRTLVTADRRASEALVPTGGGVLLVTRLP
jgi:predicted O-methyltransferase YrrM